MARNDKHLALKLRKLGKGYNFINKELGIPKSTLSDWFRDISWSKAIKSRLTERANFMAQKRMRLIAKANKERWQKWRESYRKEAVQEFSGLKKNSLFIAGLMLYWGEGDSNLKNANVRLTNTDPRMIRLFIKFAVKICKVSKKDIRLTLILYPDIDETTCMSYWCNFLKIPSTQFYKTQFILGKHPTKRLKNGICMVKIGGTGLKEKISTWINLYQESEHNMRV